MRSLVEKKVGRVALERKTKERKYWEKERVRKTHRIAIV